MKEADVDSKRDVRRSSSKAARHVGIYMQGLRQYEASLLRAGK